MKLGDYQRAYFDATTKTSEIARQLAFAGLAIIWIFKVDVSGGQRVPPTLIAPATCIVCALSFDLLQYVVRSLTWGLFSRLKERKGVKQDDQVKAPRWINWAPIVLFWTKLPLLVFAYILLLRYLAGHLFG